MKDLDWTYGDLTPEMARWERWVERVRIGDRCLCAGRPATVTAVTDDFLWARIDGRTDAEPWDWADCDEVKS